MDINRIKEIIFAVIITAALACIIYLFPCMEPGKEVMSGDAVEVCCAGSGLVENCHTNETCSDRVFCSSNNETINEQIFKEKIKNSLI